MLGFPTRSETRKCDGLSRRDFFTVGGLGLGGLALPGLLGARAAAADAGHESKNTSVVWLFLSGGPSHLDTDALDLLATIYHVLGIGPRTQFNNHSGRPIPLLVHGSAIAELV